MDSIDWKSMKNLSELTIVMLTYNRPDYALRQMRFWSGAPATLLVLDGSKNPIKKEDLEGIESNIQYYHMPCSYEERFSKALDLITTPFTISLCDDEFFVPSTLDKNITFLKQNPEYVACIGRCLKFIYLNTGISTSIKYGKFKNYRVVENTPKERVAKHMTDYMHSTMYAVQRSDVWKKTISLLTMGNFHFSCPYVLEMLIEISTVYQGKATTTDELMWLRSEENAPADGEDRKVSIHRWMQDEKYSAEVSRFTKMLEDYLPKIYLDNNVVDIFKDGFRNYIKYKKSFNDDYQATVLPKIKTGLIQFISIGTEYRIVKMSAYFNINGWLPWRKTIRKFETNEMQIDRRQLELIFNTVEKFHNYRPSLSERNIDFIHKT
jgi:glycosyltransferase domain-containing protein